MKRFKTDIESITLQKYMDSLGAVKRYFGDEPLQSITRNAYQDFLNNYGKNHAKTSAQKLNSHIRACIKDAIDEGIIRVDFTRDVVYTGTPSKKASDKHLGYDESKQLLQMIYDRLDRSTTHYLLLLALTSGMRFGEIVGLQRNDFDFFNGIININKSWGYKKNMQDGFGETKNEASVRKIKIDHETMRRFKQLFKNTPENIYQLVFYSPSSKYKVINNGTANNVLVGMLDELKAQRITVHGLRHTHASVLLYKDVSIQYISRRLGHADIDTTLNTYSHLIKEMEERDEQRSVEVFNSMLV
ncbi:site-specific integrase [Salicibibacter cibarius]|uniref:site-specific integrase n=1 Tax=Salicibibacter cibarius TaxID=2743000 RepID=UPI0031B62663